MNLSDYLWGNQKDNAFTGFYGQASSAAASTITSFTTDSQGRTKIPTATDLAAAEKPEDKLKILKQMADVVGVQADATIRTGKTGNLSGLTKSAGEMLNALTDVVNGLKTTDGSVASGEADPALEPYAGQIKSALTALRGAMDKIAMMTSNTSQEVTAQLSALDDKAGAVAKQAGTTWIRSGTSFRADSSKLLDILV
ncbi:MAG: hypothetical protein H7Y60_10900 [Rhodospirillaceae bacterium]|nr:hypothetical protein [Rhodospirillales bacterium]